MARVSDRSLYRIVASRILLSAIDRSDHDTSVAQMKPTSSRATAVAATCGGPPPARRRPSLPRKPRRRAPPGPPRRGGSVADTSETIDAAPPTRGSRGPGERHAGAHAAWDRHADDADNA